MKLRTINCILNLFLLALVIELWDGKGERTPTRLYLRSVLKVGYCIYYPHIRLLNWMGY